MSTFHALIRHWDIMTGAAYGAGNAYCTGAPDFTSGFHRGSCYPVICVSLFHVIVLSFVVWVLIVPFVWWLGLYIFYLCMLNSLFIDLNYCTFSNPAIITIPIFRVYTEGVIGNIMLQVKVSKLIYGRQRFKHETEYICLHLYLSRLCFYTWYLIWYAIMIIFSISIK